MKNENIYSLEMEKISKAFGPVKALQNVTFKARAGTLHALCGENGAGKSTLMKVLAGVHQSDTGTILINGKTMNFTSPKDALDAGISMLYQELDLAADMTVYENIYLGRELQKSVAKIKYLDKKTMIANVQSLMKKYGFTIDVEAKISSLTMGECQIVELLKALLRNAKIIVMDEPTSSLSAAESEVLFNIIHSLRKEGLTILYISHRMEEVMDLADDISILRDGEIVHSAPRSDLDVNTIVKYMVGRELNDFYPKRDSKIGEVVFEVKKLNATNGIKDVSFVVRRGEIVGMSGLVGAGRSETAQAIFGIVPVTSGEIFLNGKALKISNPTQAIKNGIAFLTEDRKRNGLCVNLPCSWNLTLPNLDKIDMDKILNLSRERQICREYGEKVKVKWAEPDSHATTLSGGNQQKVLIARWLLANSDFMIFDEPTRGIDIGAKKEIYQLLNELAVNGKAILVISSELPELLGISDRILVMKDREIKGEFSKEEATAEKIMHISTN